jgi:hypothetical protein
VRMFKVIIAFYISWPFPGARRQVVQKTERLTRFNIEKSSIILSVKFGNGNERVCKNSLKAFTMADFDRKLYCFVTIGEKREFFDLDIKISAKIG